MSARIVGPPSTDTTQGAPSVNIRHLLIETAGPFQDFHGAPPRAIDLLTHLVPASERQSMSLAEWKDMGHLEVILLNDSHTATQSAGASDQPPTGAAGISPKWSTKTFSMEDPIVF
jgi:hypothetical protein